ncbi:MAG: thiamine-phosphate kinase, partial [Candidatus Thorarchaeota archaeon]
RGYSQYCLKSGIPFIGGDLGSSSEVVLTGVAIGMAAPVTIVTRSGTKEGDIIAVTDLFGLTSVAFEILINGLNAEGDLRDDALGAAYKPKIHFRFVSSLAENGAITASMDSSDGLGITLHTMANLSSLRFVIDNIPVAKGVEHFARNNLLDTMKLVMQGGEEFIVVLTVPADRWDDAMDVAEKQHVALRAIGTTRKGSGVCYESPEGLFEIPLAGYDNFKEWG